MTVPLLLGAKRIFTTLFESIGMTTVTEFETFTVKPQASFQSRGVFFDRTPPLPLSTFTETSHPVVKETEFLSTIFKEIRYRAFSKSSNLVKRYELWIFLNLGSHTEIHPQSGHSPQQL